MLDGEKVRVGVIGLGNMGGVHARELLAGRVQHAELAAVCDLETSALEPFAALPCFRDSSELIAIPVSNSVRGRSASPALTIARES